jgi:caffeoyl-CoA O-methyltransferase
VSLYLRLTTCLMAAALLACAQGPRGRMMGGGDGYGNAPLAADAAEKRILEVAAGVERHLNVPLEDGRLIRMLAESIGAKTAVEFGTSTGYSGLWFALALRKTGGRLITHEYDAGRAATARANFERAGVADLITIVVGDAHETAKNLKGPIDIVFIDADKEGYLDYLNKVLPHVRPGGLILAHNISRISQNPAYMDAVTTNPALETMRINAEMAVTLKKR